MDTSNKSNQKSSTKAAKAGLLVAFTASLCCITPVLALISGVGGVAATFSWMEPLRPFMIALTLGVLGFAWYQKLKPRKAEEIACDCEEDGKEPFIQSKMFLGIVTVIGITLLSFPSYSHIFYPDNSQKTTADIEISNIQQINFDIKGMTCTGCEEHVKHAVNEVEGVTSVSASFEDGKATVQYVKQKVSKESIIDAINETGYTVVKSEVNTPDQLIEVNTNAFSPISKIEFKVEGMTCTGCEEHVKYTTNQVEGVQEVTASYEKGSAIVAYDQSKATREQIVEAINSTGYKVIE